MTSMAIEVHDLRRSHGEIDAVRGVSFEVARGEVFCLLGPNGAGKTTTVEILEGYRERSGGEVAVLATIPPTASETCARGWGSSCNSAASSRT
jgi:ABC-2 type transport system ATP-binding protein